MAEAWREQGFRVEVCEYTDETYSRPSDCAVAIDLHSNLERWKEKLPAGCLKILHATGCHWRFSNQAEANRIASVQERRGIELQPRRQVAPNLAAETADEITFLGNDHTISTYDFAQKPSTRIPISSAYEFCWPVTRDFEAAKRRFLWMGSYGMVHKGLDLVLEAFASEPDLELTVCGRPEKEPDFFRAYERELQSLANIRLRGWIDHASEAFAEIAASHGAVIYPSSSEGGGGAVIHCMHAGLVPICTKEASVDLESSGIAVAEPSVAGVIAAVRSMAGLPGAEAADRARAAYDHARQIHSRTCFRDNYREFAARLASRLN